MLNNLNSLCSLPFSSAWPIHWNYQRSQDDSRKWLDCFGHRACKCHHAENHCPLLLDIDKDDMETASQVEDHHNNRRRICHKPNTDKSYKHNQWDYTIKAITDFIKTNERLFNVLGYQGYAGREDWQGRKDQAIRYDKQISKVITFQLVNLKRLHSIKDSTWSTSKKLHKKNKKLNFTSESYFVRSWISIHTI